MVEFADVDSLVAACARVRDEGFKRWDAFTPFPVHGMDDAMGIRMTRLPWLSLAGGLAGATAGLLLQWYTNVYDYPFMVSGKPFFSLPANIPVIFELTVLFAALCTFIGMFVFNRLPSLYHPLFSSERFLKVTDDRFFIVVEAGDPLFDPAKTKEFLASLGGEPVEAVED